ncbi:MAG TPA: tetratricopeptide repeat protein [Bryobacteraceae bacterium]|nr:tetratricopeptide repeat protein [Bryobacteraceae bacterium]
MYNILVLQDCSASARRRASIAILFAGILLLAGCHSAQSYLEKGNALFARGQFEDATLNYRKAIQKDSSFGEAYYRAGLAEVKQQQTLQALQDLQQAVRLLPNNADAKLQLTNLLLGAYIGDPQRPKFLYDLLLKFSQEWLAKDPNSMQGLRITGYIAMLEQRPEEAVTKFRRAHQLYPHDEKITDGLMDALFRANQPGEAEQAGLQFLNSNPSASDVYDALYRLYATAHRTQDAENILKRKVSANPKENAYLLELAAFYAGSHRKPEMDQTLQKLLSNPGRDPAIHLQAGDFYTSLGDLPNALLQYRAGSSANSSSRQDKLLYQNRIARVLLLQNNRKQGLQVLNQTLAQYPDDAEALALRAALLVGTPSAGKPGEGIKDMRDLLDKNPNDLFMKYLLARGLIESHDLGEARTRLQEVVRMRPQFLDAHVLLADIAFQQGDMVEAVRQAESALDIDPQNLRARMLRGSALLKQGDLDQAASVLGSLARQVPGSVDVQLQLAYVSLNKRSYAAAEAGFNKILEKHPTEWRAVSGLVDVDLAQNQPGRAYSRLEEELTRSHGSPAVRYLMATTALRNGRYDDAIDNFRQLANQTPNSIDALLQLAQVYQLKGDTHSAIAALQRAALIQPKDPRPGSLLPFVLEAANREQEAKQAARRALAQRPDDPEAMNNLAYLLAQTGDSLDEALSLARKAVSKSPKNPAYLDTLGYVYLKRDQNDDALDIFQNLIRKYPDDPACAYHTGMAWYQKGDRAKARTLISHALDLSPPKDIESEANDLLRRLN